MASLSTFKPYELYNTVNYLVKVPLARSLPKKRAAHPVTQHPSDPMGQMYPPVDVAACAAPKMIRVTKNYIDRRTPCQ